MRANQSTPLQQKMVPNYAVYSTYTEVACSTFIRSGFFISSVTPGR
jgi:hypothetical protein